LRNKQLFIIAKHGLAAASRLNNTKEIEDYIELTFRKI
jgi:TetR/AcrR family transcriptional repressor of nem operon